MCKSKAELVYYNSHDQDVFNSEEDEKSHESGEDDDAVDAHALELEDDLQGNSLRRVPPTSMSDQVKEGASKYVGFSFYKKWKKWIARISINGKDHTLAIMTPRKKQQFITLVQSSSTKVEHG